VQISKEKEEREKGRAKKKGLLIKKKTKFIFYINNLKLFKNIKKVI
jgi:hypothetical protein